MNPDLSQTAVVDVDAETQLGTPFEETGRFTVLRPHAAGGLGEVSVARDNQLDREIALKQIKWEYARDPRQRSRFKLEAEVTGGLEHPGIVPVYSLGQYADGRPYYAMRFIRGGSLRDSIEAFHRKPDFASLEFRSLLRRFVDVCNAIAYAHSRGVLHRDLKPGNIMLGEYGETLVVDWGLAKTLGKPDSACAGESTLPLTPPSMLDEGSATEPGSALGTPSYMSPEQAAGDGDALGPATDVYSLGATLYAMLVGRPPFGGTSALDVVRDVLEGRFVPPRQVAPAVPVTLDAICQKAMALDPSGRYASALELAADVERFLADEPTTARCEPFSVRLRRWIRKHPGPVSAVAAAVLVGLVGSAIGMGAIGRKNRDLNAALAREAAQRSKAEGEFRRAKSAIDEYFTAVSESQELKEKYPGLQAFRLGLLEKAQRYYDEYLAEHRNNSSLQADVAETLCLRAAIAKEIGQKPQALDALQRSRALFEQLSNGDRAMDAKLAKVNNAMGIVLRELGRPEEALACLRSAQTSFARLHADEPSSTALAAELAGSLTNIGRLESETGKFDAALSSFRSAIALQEKLAAENIGAPRHAADLASSLNNAGIVHIRLGQPTEAFACYRKALAIRERLAHEQPAAAEFAAELALAHNNLGLLQSAVGSSRDAAQSYRKALAVRERLARENPRVTQFAADLARSHVGIGLLQASSNQSADAIASLGKALSIHEKLAAEQPESIEYAIDRAGALCAMGNVTNAAKSPADALRSFDQAIALLAAPAKTHVAARQHLRDAHWGRGKALARLGQGTAAVAAMDAALQFDSGPKSAAIRKDRAALLAKLPSSANKKIAPTDHPTKGKPR